MKIYYAIRNRECSRAANSAEATGKNVTDNSIYDQSSFLLHLAASGSELEIVKICSTTIATKRLLKNSYLIHYLIKKKKFVVSPSFTLYK